MALNLNSSSSLALSEKPANIPLNNPDTGEQLYDVIVDASGKEIKLPVTLNVYGVASKVHRSATHRMRNRTLSSKDKKDTAEKQDVQWTDFLVAITESISNLAYEGVNCDNPTTIRALFEDPSFIWIKEQVSTGQAETAAFLGR